MAATIPPAGAQARARRPPAGRPGRSSARGPRGNRARPALAGPVGSGAVDACRALNAARRVVRADAAAPIRVAAAAADRRTASSLGRRPVRARGRPVVPIDSGIGSGAAARATAATRGRPAGSNRPKGTRARGAGRAAGVAEERASTVRVQCASTEGAGRHEHEHARCRGKPCNPHPTPPEHGRTIRLPAGAPPRDHQAG